VSLSSLSAYCSDMDSPPRRLLSALNRFVILLPAPLISVG
jgi:hypothetical protein